MDAEESTLLIIASFIFVGYSVVKSTPAVALPPTHAVPSCFIALYAKFKLAPLVVVLGGAVVVYIKAQ